MEATAQLSLSIKHEPKPTRVMPTKEELLKACEELEDCIKGFTLSDICFQAGYSPIVLGEMSKELQQELVERASLSQTNLKQSIEDKFDTYSDYNRFANNWEYLRKQAKRRNRGVKETTSLLGTFPQPMS